MIYAVNIKTKRHIIMKEDVGAGATIPDTEGEYWRLVEADAAGWIEWDGGECPLPDGDGVHVMTNIGIANAGPAGEFRWSRQSRSGDIIAYRPILDAVTKPEPPAWDGESWPPPVGSVIESSATLYDGTPAEVLAVRHGEVIGCHVDTGVAGWLEPEYCRPLRSEEDRAVEAMADVMREADGVVLTGRTQESIARALYRAGYRKEES